MDALREGIEESLPIFRNLDRNLRVIIDGLRAELADAEGRDEDFRKLTAAQRQKILFYESAISSLLFLDLSDKRREITELYKSLGIFYSTKFSVAAAEEAEGAEEAEPMTDPLSRMSVGAITDHSVLPLESDLHRAHFYFDRALEHTTEPAHILNLKGTSLMFLSRPEWMQQATHLFERSLLFDPRQQKPHWNLAMIALQTTQHLDVGEQHLRDALACPYFDHPDSPRQDSELHVALAVVSCLRAGSGSETEHHVDAALASLRDAIGARKPTDKPSLAEWFDDSYLHFWTPLTATPAGAEAFATLKGQLLAEGTHERAGR